MIKKPMDGRTIQDLIGKGSEVTILMKRLLYPGQPYNATIALELANNLTCLRLQMRELFPEESDEVLYERLLHYSPQDLSDAIEMSEDFVLRRTDLRKFMVKFGLLARVLIKIPLPHDP